MKPINITIHADERDLHFASLDGEHFVEVNRPAYKAETHDLERLATGDGMKPMTVSRRFLELIALHYGWKTS
jgi:hypothetical protein